MAEFGRAIGKFCILRMSSKKGLTEQVGFYYNGIENDLNDLFKFVFVYEKMNKEGKLSSESEEVFKDKIKPHILLLQSGDEFTVDHQKDKTLIFRRNDSLIKDFCRHLRNSICHAKIFKVNQCLYIPDFKNKKEEVTCQGYIEISAVKEFVKTIIKNYETSNTQNG